MENLTTNIGFCARCGKDHLNLTFYKFAKPAGRETHWTPCPETGEPILLRVSESEESSKHTTAQVPFEFEGRNFVAEIDIAPVRKSSNGERDVFIFKIMDAGVFENGELLGSGMGLNGHGWNNFAVLFDVTRS